MYLYVSDATDTCWVPTIAVAPAILRLNSLTTALVTLTTIPSGLDAGLPYIVTLTGTGGLAETSAWNPDGMRMPLVPECAARYWEKLTPGATWVIVMVFVRLSPWMNPKLAGELLSLFWR